MRRALRLADKGRGRVSPNPLVGAVVVHDGEIIGEGAHLRVGAAHAEVNALRDVGTRARGATLYVTLEPCSFHGRTPPCCDAVIDAGIARVVCPLEDPDERVRGAGFKRLEKAGVSVEVGVLEDEAARRNAPYLKHRRCGLPWVVLKLAQSLDGNIATSSGDARWISGERSRRLVHRWRSWVDAIMVGAGTVASDDPQLTVRQVRGRDPRVIIVDGQLRAPTSAQVFQRPGTVVATLGSNPTDRQAAYTDLGVEVWPFTPAAERIDLRQLLTKAGTAEITSVMVEGGAGLAATALADQVVDEVMIFVAPLLLGEGVASIGQLGIDRVDHGIRLDHVRIRRLGEDILLTGEVRYPCSPD
jgi:diaminohydroxyphosphoribosylaminopyrimidine deaminase/5-amino-6-(5-phosphoribosylamino)uracil reductase